MKMLKLALTFIAVLLSAAVLADDRPDPARDILVTFDNNTARSRGAGLSSPYQYRKRYSIANKVRRDAAMLEKEYSLTAIDHWPIKSLSVYCFVYRIPDEADRQSIIESLNADARVESAQPLQSFETSVSKATGYDDTYADLQYGLDILDIAAAHRTTRGAGIRIAMIDSSVDTKHEDLQGRIDRVREFSNKGESIDLNHGTAIASIIGARSNNAVGIVGIAPEATLELYVSCWSGGAEKSAVCDTFSISKALDAILDDPPHVLNLSLVGPHDPLLERLIQKAFDIGIVLVAATPSQVKASNRFPANMQQVIGVATTPGETSVEHGPADTVFAPGHRILVAVPASRYDFRSGSSLATAHVSGVVALLLSIAPDSTSETISRILRRSQIDSTGEMVSINACDALNMTRSKKHCAD